MLYQVLEHRRVQLVSNLLAMAFGHHETGFPKHGKVPGNRRPAGIESIGDLSRRERSIPQQPKNHPPRLVSEGAECLIGRTHGPVLPCMISKLANYNRGVKNNSCHGPRPRSGRSARAGLELLEDLELLRRQLVLTRALVGLRQPVVRLRQGRAPTAWRAAAPESLPCTVSGPREESRARGSPSRALDRGQQLVGAALQPVACRPACASAG